MQGHTKTATENDVLAGQVLSLEAEVRHLQQALQVCALPELQWHPHACCLDAFADMSALCCGLFIASSGLPETADQATTGP